MAQNVKGTPNWVSLLPTAVVVAPTGYTIVPTGSNLVSALSDSDDATYVEQTQADADNHIWLRCASATMPSGARVIFVRGVARAKRDVLPKGAMRHWVVALADDSTKQGLTVGSRTSSTLDTSWGNYQSPTSAVLSDGKTLIDQAQIDHGLIVQTGEVTSGVDDASVFSTARAYVELCYDKPPTATYTGPTGTITTTSSPTIQWDYSDDVGAQAKYLVTLINSSGDQVYTSGIVSSGNTYHVVDQALANDTYTARVLVYQVWNGPGGDFPANSVATGTFTLNVTLAGAPTLSASDVEAGVALTCHPDSNFTEPTINIDYSEDGGTTWALLASIPNDSGSSYVFTDYEIKSGVPRTYRSYYSQTVSGVTLVSHYSATASGSVTLKHSWLHTRNDPANTLHNFVYDGGGRTSDFSPTAAMTAVAGRSLPFAEFSGEAAGSLQATISCVSDDDIQAMRDIATAQSEVVFRDQRGRSVRGVMTTATFTDQPYGADVAVTITLSGEQP